MKIFFYPTKDSIALDDDFTLEGKKRWSFSRYNSKKNLLAKTYIAAGKGNMPAIIGLCEVENDKVLYDLCKDSPLRKENYKYIHYTSQDIRGIDVALLYNEQFSPLSHCKLEAETDPNEEKNKRCALCTRNDGRSKTKHLRHSRTLSPRTQHKENTSHQNIYNGQ